MSEKNLGTQINDLYLQFCAGTISRRQLAKRVGALGVSAAAVNMFMRGVPASAQDASPMASPSAGGTFEPFTSIKRDEWKQTLMKWWAEQDPPYQDPQNQGGQIVMGELASSFVSTTNYMLGSDSPTNPVLSLTFETLVGSSPIDGAYVPGLADYWEIAEDGKTYTFHINPNVTWQDGTPMTSADVIFSMGIQANPDTGSAYTAESGSLDNLVLDGSGNLVSLNYASVPHSYAASSLGGPAPSSSYTLSVTFTVTASSSTSPDTVSFDAATRLETGDKWLVELFIGYGHTTLGPGYQWFLAPYVANSDGTTVYSPSNIDVSSLITAGEHIASVEVSPTGTVWKIDDIVVAANSGVPDSAPDSVVFTNEANIVSAVGNINISKIELSPLTTGITYIYDSFTGADGTSVLGAPHIGEVGATWTRVAGFGADSNGEFVIHSNAIRRPTFAEDAASDGGEALMYASGALPGGTTAFTMEFGFTFDESAAGGTGQFIALYEKCDTAGGAGSSYICQVGINVLSVASGRVGLSHDGGTTASSVAFTNNHAYVARLTVNGTALTLDVLDGGSVIAKTSWTRGTMPLGKFGIDMFDSASVAAATVTYFKVAA